ncbi:MAG: 1,2-phenylacetyl-CoA epoxidase subunit PaaC [Rhodoferax sp.]
MNAANLNSVNYLLHLADNALVLGQRNAEWCGHGPVLEEDIAMANIGLDHIGQCRLLYQHAAGLMGGGATEDRLAYFRAPEAFRNYVLLELPHSTAYAPSTAVERDYAVTITRNFLYSSLMNLLWDALQGSKDAQLAAISAKSLKEVRYHLRHSTDWMLRLGDGTVASNARMQAALDHLMPYTQELWTASAFETAALAQGIGADTAGLQAAWQQSVGAVVAEAGLKAASSAGHITRGKEGLHSEHLSYLLAEMQSLARAHPDAVW